MQSLKYQLPSNDVILQQINNGEIFPYKKLFWRQSKQEIFVSLKNFNVDKILTISNRNISVRGVSNNTKYKGKTYTLVHKLDEYWFINVLSDLYVEEERVKSKLISEKESPIEWFVNNKSTIPHELLPFERREYIYANVREASQFKLTISKYLYRLFGASKILDPCAGWGDRLLSAMVLGLEYHGYDPNSALHPHYNQMIADFGSDKKHKVDCVPFEDVTLEPEYYDFSLCSPPYFDFEQYSNENTQSIQRYKTADNWLNHFMYKLIDNVYHGLKIGSYFVLHLSDNRFFSLTDKVLQYANTKFNYEGCIFSQDEKASPKPLWVYRKL